MKKKLIALLLACLMVCTPVFTACNQDVNQIETVTGEPGRDGADGKDGVDGKDGQDGKSAYELAVEKGYKGTLEEWLASLIGEAGANGKDGTQGKQGIQGEPGVGVTNAYVNEEYHLILVLTDGTEVDAGYVGVVICYTVTYNWNCDDPSLITTSIVVDKGTVLQLPSIPERENAVFTGWYVDAACTEAFDLSAPIQSDTTIYAGWREETYEDVIANQNAELDNLKVLNDGELPTIMLQEETYTPAFILGTYSDETVTDFDSAKKSLKAVENLMGFHNVEEEYVEVSSSTFKGTTQYRLQQMYNGYIVYGQQLIVTTDEAGKVTSLSGDYATIGTQFNPSVHISVSDAITIAAEYNEFESTNVTLVVYALDGYNEMAYVLENDVYTVVVSAYNGTIISAYAKVLTSILSITEDDEITSTTGRDEDGTTFNTSYIDYSDPTKQDSYIFYDKVRDIVYRDFEMVDSQSKELIGYEDFLVDDDNVWTSDVSQKAINLFKNLSDTYDFYLEVLGLMSYDGNGGQIWAYVNDGYDNGENAYSSGPHNLDGEVVSVLSFGGVANSQNSLDVVAHEYTHSVQSSLTNLQYRGQSGALMEAYADVMGELVELSVTSESDWKHNDRHIKNPQSCFEWFFQWAAAYPEKLNGVGYYTGTNDHGGVHHNSTVISHAVYKMFDRGLNDVAELTELLYRAWGYLTSTATFYDYRMAMLAAANDMNFTAEKISYITEAFDDANVVFESYDDSWQISAMVNLYSKVVDNNGDVVPNAHILVERTDANGTDVAEVQCDENGEHRIDLSTAGSYRITVSAIGYETHENIYNFGMFTSPEITFTLTKETAQSVVCKVGGQITDALTGEALTGVVMRFRKGYNITAGGVELSLTTDEFGKYYTAALEYGFYTVELSKSGYITSYMIIQAAANWENSDHDHENVLSQNFSISPMVQQGGTLRIVLTWGRYPSDLDSHLFGKTTDDSSYHVYYSSKHVFMNDESIVELDIDDTSSYGPETITVDLKQQGEIIRYCVHDYSTYNDENSMVLASSEAKIQVYLDNSLIATYSVPSTQAGTVWHVFNYDAATGQILTNNVITNNLYE